MFDRNQLENKLDTVISSVYNNKIVVDKFCENMMRFHNIRLGTSLDIIGRNLDVREVSKEKLLWITKELASAVMEDEETAYLASGLELKKYFTDVEIKTIQDAKFKNEYYDDVFPLVIEGVLRVNDDQFVTVKSVDFIKELRDKQIIRYNPETQREQTMKKTSSGFRYVITLVKSAVKQIMELMQEGKFISNAISLNINADEPAEFEYDEANMTLTIYSGTIDIIDGYHRYISMTNVKDNASDFQYNTILNIMNFGEDKAKRYIVQENKRNSIAKSKIKSLDVDNRGSAVVKYLNENSQSNLKDMITTNKGSLIKFGLLSDLINYNFPMKSNQDVIKVKKYTFKAFNALIEDDLSLLEKKQHDLKWVFYVRVMAKHYSTGDIDAFIEDIHKINSIEFDKLDIKFNTIGKTLYKKVDNIIANME